jgi:hypothetical protein
MTIQTSTVSIDVDMVATIQPNFYVVDQNGISSINAALAAANSEYQFLSIDGSSAYPGGTVGGNMGVEGDIQSVVGGGSDTFLSLTESQTTTFQNQSIGFGPFSSFSYGYFTNQAPGGGHTASSTFNGIPTPTYSVLSARTDFNLAFTNVSVGYINTTFLFTMTNTITFDLSSASADNVDDTFHVLGTLGAIPVPEPGSFVLLLIGAPAMAIFQLRRRTASPPRR